MLPTGEWACTTGLEADGGRAHPPRTEPPNLVGSDFISMSNSYTTRLVGDYLRGDGPPTNRETSDADLPDAAAGGVAGDLGGVSAASCGEDDYSARPSRSRFDRDSDESEEEEERERDYKRRRRVDTENDVGGPLAEVGRRQGDTRGVFSSYKQLAFLFSDDIGDHRTAVYFWEKCAEIARLTNDAECEVEATRALGIAHEALGDVRLALTFYQKLQRLTSDAQAEDDEKQAWVLLHNANVWLAEAATAAGELREALELRQTCLQTAQAAGDKSMIGKAHYEMGQAHERLRDIDELLKVCARPGAPVGRTGSRLSVSLPLICPAPLSRTTIHAHARTLLAVDTLGGSDRRRAVYRWGGGTREVSWGRRMHLYRWEGALCQ